MREEIRPEANEDTADQEEMRKLVQTRIDNDKATRESYVISTPSSNDAYMVRIGGGVKITGGDLIIRSASPIFITGDTEPIDVGVTHPTSPSRYTG